MYKDEADKSILYNAWLGLITPHLLLHDMTIRVNQELNEIH